MKQPLTSFDYREIVSKLTTFRYQYHTYTLEENKRQHVVIRGLPETSDVNETFEELGQRGYGIKNVIRMTSRMTNRALPLYLTKFDMEEKECWKIKNLLTH